MDNGCPLRVRLLETPQGWAGWQKLAQPVSSANNSGFGLKINKLVQPVHNKRRVEPKTEFGPGTEGWHFKLDNQMGF